MMTKTDELMELMIQEGERLLDDAAAIKSFFMVTPRLKKFG